MTRKFTESTIEEAVLEWTGELGYAILSGPDIAPGESAAERTGFDDVVLLGRLRDAIARINPNIPDEAREEAIAKQALARCTSAGIVSRVYWNTD